MLNPTDDEEEFVVIKAGPPLPLRRPRPLKSNPVTSNISPRPFPNYSSIPRPHPQHNSSCPLHHPILHGHTGQRQIPSAAPAETCQSQPEPSASAFSPQPITSVLSSLSSVSKISLENASTPPAAQHEDVTKGVKPTNSSTSTSTSASTTPAAMTSRSRSVSPSRGSTTTLKSRPSTPSINVESKVKQYIEQVKKFDEEQRFKKGGRLEKKEKFLSLEDLYQVPPTPQPEVNNSQNQPQMEERLRETLRVIKEKDEIIDKLRESCHDLKIKWADAENRIDEMRFGRCGGSQGTATLINGQQGRRSSLSMYGSGINSKISMQQQSPLPKRSSSEISLLRHSIHKETNTDCAETRVKGVDKATETETEKEDKIEVVKKGAKTKVCGSQIHEPERRKVGESTSQATTNEVADEALSPDFDLDSGSNFDLVLEEKCSNWLEKIQNWKTDPHNHNTSLDVKDKDSCGDRDSGFRGSAELEQAVLNSSRSRVGPSTSRRERQKSCATSTSATATSKSTTRKQSSQSKVKEVTGESTPDTKLSPETTVPVGTENAFPLSIQTMAAHYNLKQEQQQANASFIVEGGQSQSQGQNNSSLTTHAPPGPSGSSSLHFAQPWNTFTGNVNPYSATDYEGFPSFYSSSNSSHLDKQQYSSYNSHASPHHHHHHRSISMDQLNTFSSPKNNWSPHHDHAQHSQKGGHHLHSTSDPNPRELFNRMDRRFQTLNPLLDSTIDIAMRLKEKTENLAKLLKENSGSVQPGEENVTSVNDPPKWSNYDPNDSMNGKRFWRSKPKRASLT